MTNQQPQTEVEPKPEATSRTPSDLTPHLVKRVHELYEDLGRKDLQAVEDMENTERESRKAEVKTEPKPDKYRINFLEDESFTIIIGPISSIFDYATFFCYVFSTIGRRRAILLSAFGVVVSEQFDTVMVKLADSTQKTVQVTISTRIITDKNATDNDIKPY